MQTSSDLSRADPDIREPSRISLGALFVACLIPFVVLATFNSAGYRYGASDQAFYLPAILERIDPSLFPRDSDLIQSQATLTAVDETVAAAARHLPVTLPALFALLYLVALALLLGGALLIAERLYRTTWASVALVAALTLRHAISRTGTNTLEGYFHPRQLAFGLGVLAVGVFLRRGPAWPGILLIGAALLHPTTALWFVIWLGIAAIVAEPRLRAPLVLAAASGFIAGVWALAVGPLQGRLAPMDPAWLQTLRSKEYLFPLQWPLWAWTVNLAYAPLIIWIYGRRRRIGAITPRESGLVWGCLSLLAVFACAVALHAWRIALAIQLQPARIFWMLDVLATVYLVWLLAEGSAHRPRRRAAAVAAVVIALTVARSAYVGAIRFPERSFATLGIPDDDWGRVMTWARTSTDVSSHWLADPVHAARYGTSVRVAGHRDVFVEEIKDAAIGMYSRPVAIRTRDRLDELGHFGELGPDRANELAERYGLDYLVADRPFDLPEVFQSGRLRVYRLQ